MHSLPIEYHCSGTQNPPDRGEGEINLPADMRRVVSTDCSTSTSSKPRVKTKPKGWARFSGGHRPVETIFKESSSDETILKWVEPEPSKKGEIKGQFPPS